MRTSSASTWLSDMLQIILAATFSTQLAFLILRSRSAALKTAASLASDTLSLIATATLAAFQLVHYRRSSRSLSLVSLYLSAYAILGTAKARTLWTIHPGSGAACIFIAILALTFLALAAETASGRKDSSAEKQSPEQYSAFWTRTVFAWLSATFKLGYAKVISVDDLPPLDSKLQSLSLHKQLKSKWKTHDRKRRNSLLLACLRAYWPSFLSAVIPRLCLSGFTFAQPFLISSTISFVGEDRHSRENDYGKGLVGAWALVFMGIAVHHTSTDYMIAWQLTYTCRSPTPSTNTKVSASLSACEADSLHWYTNNLWQLEHATKAKSPRWLSWALIRRRS